MENEKTKVIKEILENIEDLKDRTDSIKDEYQEIYDKMSENAQDSDKGKALEELIDALDETVTNFDYVVSDLEEGIDYLETSLAKAYEDEEEENVANNHGDQITKYEEMTILQRNSNAENIKANKDDIYKQRAKELKKNIQVLTKTFETNGLQFLGFGCRAYSEGDPDLVISVEMLSNTELSEDLVLRINLYDDEENLFLSESQIVPEGFSGYSTFTISVLNKPLLYAIKGKLYISKY